MTDVQSQFDAHMGSPIGVFENSCCGSDIPRYEDTSLSDGLTPAAKRIFSVAPNEAEDAGITLDTPMRAMTQSAVWRCASLIANTAARISLNVISKDNRGGMMIDPSHQSYRLMRYKPNQMQHAFDFKRQVLFHALLWGNFIGLIRRNKDGAPRDIRPLDPSQTGLIATNDGRIMYWTTLLDVRGQQKIRHVKPENVLHIKGMSFDGLWGLRATDYMAGSLGVAIGARKFGAKFFGKGARPGGIIKLPASYSAEETEEFAGAFSKQYEGLDNALKMMFLNESEMEFVPFAYNNDQAQFTETRTFEDRQIANFFGVHPSTVGIEDATSYNSLEMAKQSELDAVEPWLCAIEAECNEKLLRRAEKLDESHCFKFKREEIKQTDHQTMIESAILELNNGGMTLNEYRMKFDRPALDDDGDKARKPVNIGYIDDVQVNSMGEGLDDNSGGKEKPGDSGDQNNSQREERLFSLLHKTLFRQVNRVCKQAERAISKQDKFCQFLDEKLSDMRDEFLSCVSDITLAIVETNAADKMSDAFFSEFHASLDSIARRPGGEANAYEDAKRVVERHRSDGYIESLISRGYPDGRD